MGFSLGQLQWFFPGDHCEGRVMPWGVFPPHQWMCDRKFSSSSSKSCSNLLKLYILWPILVCMFWGWRSAVFIFETIYFVLFQSIPIPSSRFPWRDSCSISWNALGLEMHFSTWIYVALYEHGKFTHMRYCTIWWCVNIKMFFIFVY